MSIQYAILGLLSRKPSTGYELKKMFEESSILYWSGNNNQIYKALLQLQDEGWVTGEVIHQDSSPSKKVYTITEEGLAELKDWIQTSPEAPECKKLFLIQFAWSDLLNGSELRDLLAGYENELNVQILMEREKARRAQNRPGRSRRETLIWELISENLISSCQAELDWVRAARQRLSENQMMEERGKMNYQLIQTAGKRYVELISTETPLRTQKDTLDIIALCGEQDTNLLMLHAGVLSEDFFRLKTGVAGEMIQKFINYSMKVAVILPGEFTLRGAFREMVLEANQGRQLRLYESREEAEEWLLQ